MYYTDRKIKYIKWTIAVAALLTSFVMLVAPIIGLHEETKMGEYTIVSTCRTSVFNLLVGNRDAKIEMRTKDSIGEEVSLWKVDIIDTAAGEENSEFTIKPSARLIFILLFFVAMYCLMIRKAIKKATKQQENNPAYKPNGTVIKKQSVIAAIPILIAVAIVIFCLYACGKFYKICIAVSPYILPVLVCLSIFCMLMLLYCSIISWSNPHKLNARTNTENQDETSTKQTDTDIYETDNAPEMQSQEQVQQLSDDIYE